MCSGHIKVLRFKIQPGVKREGVSEMTEPTWSKFLQTWDLVPGNHLGHPDAERIYDEIKGLISKFVPEVYNGGLRRIVRGGKWKELTGVFDNVRVNTYVLRGRVYVYFRSIDRDPEEKIVFVADQHPSDPRNPGMVLSEIIATNSEVVKKMVETIINWWENGTTEMRKVRNKQEAIPGGCNS